MLRRLAGLDLILVGGQAINVWAARYLERLEELANEGPFTSKDVDFCGGAEAVRECARRLEGEPFLPEDVWEQHSPVNTGVVTFTDDTGFERTIDVLIQPLGVDIDELKGTCVEIDVQGAKLKIMHPVLCVEGRVANVLGLGRRDEHTLRQLRASVLCAREFLRDVFSSEAPRDVLSWNERIYSFALSRDGIAVFHQHHVDVFQAALVDDRLPEKFLQRRYPQMKKRLETKRARGVRSG